MDRWEKPLRDQHENNKKQQHARIKPVQWPIKIGCKPNQNSCKYQENFFCIEIKWTEVHIFRIKNNLLKYKGSSNYKMPSGGGVCPSGTLIVIISPFFRAYLYSTHFILSSSYVVSEILSRSLAFTPVDIFLNAISSSFL